MSLRNGKRALVVGQKSGILYALDPDQKGKILWQARLGQGGFLGGLQWGSAVEGDRVYTPLSDIRFTSDVKWAGNFSPIRRRAGDCSHTRSAPASGCGIHLPRRAESGVRAARRNPRR